MPEVALSLTTGPAAGYLAVPPVTSDRPGPWPGVIMIHDVFGLHDDIRIHADTLAAAGFLTLAPDLFGGKAAIRCIQGAFRQLMSRRGPMFDMVDAARQWLVERDDCAGRSGVIGFCMGGGFALLFAGRGEFDVASVNYGMVPEDVDAVLSEPCPIVASYGGRDRSISGGAARVEAALAPSGVDRDVKEYPGVGHAFMNRLVVGSPLNPLLKVFKATYDHPSAEDANRRILEFFDRHLRT